MSLERIWLKVLIFILLLAILTQPILSRPIYIKEFKDFPDDIKRCELCHIQSSGYGGLNSFGRDFSLNKKLTDDLMRIDSDKDGFSNIEELKSGTFPGNPDSHPGSKAPGFSAFSMLAILLILSILRNI